MKYFFILLIFCSAALADALSEARELYSQGQFLNAAKLFATLNTSAGSALAARAYSIYASTLPEAKRETYYIEAESQASRAINQDSQNANAYFELARATGQLGVLRGIGMAILQGTGTKIRQLLDKTLELQNNHAGAMVALAVWHAEVSARGSLAAISMGADTQRIEPLFKEALKLAPNNIGFRIEYARAYIAMNNREKAREQLHIALKLPVKDAEDKLNNERAKAALERLV
jgi:tetratricopeptide (TPR) repeat protein